MTSPLDRAALAAALKDATPAILREDAALAVVRWQNAREDIARMGGTPSDNPLNHSELRLAALALGCADLEENGRSVAFFGKPVRWDRVEIDGDDVDCAAQGPTLAAALAALLKGDQ